MASPSDRWTISRPAFERLLERLGEGEADGALEYERVRRKLIAFLELRGARSPEGAADETLDRVARRLEAGEAVQHVRAYVFGVARLVLLEDERHGRRERTSHAAWMSLLADRDPAEDERRLHCLEECLQKLPAESRELVARYHGASRPSDREDLARRFGLTSGALRTRVHRLRNELAACLSHCLGTRP